METTHRKVAKLKIDLANYRTVPQDDDYSAIHAMISLEPEYFWGLTDSLIEDGYVPTENIVLLKAGKHEVVKEGNRRIGALKLILGLVTLTGLPVPEAIEQKIRMISPEVKRTLEVVPCLLFDESEAKIVDRIVARVHGRIHKASRLDWNSVARARHNREENGRTENGLDLLEKYLEHGKNITQKDRELWAGDYRLTVLNDALPRLSQAMEVSTADMLSTYPAIKNRTGFEEILHDIGTGKIGFPHVRSKEANFTVAYGFKASMPASGPAMPQPPVARPPTSGAPVPGPGGGVQPPLPKAPPLAHPLNDPRTVKAKLRGFTPRGADREKLASFLNEAKKLKIADCPLSFCFILRGMFEISAKAYAQGHAIPLIDPQKKRDKYLADLLDEIAKDLTKALDKTHPLKKAVNGAVTELKSPNGLLSITSLNGIVHGPSFSLDEKHICTRFNNVFPLLVAMN